MKWLGAFNEHMIGQLCVTCACAIGLGWIGSDDFRYWWLTIIFWFAAALLVGNTVLGFLTLIARKEKTDE